MTSLVLVPVSCSACWADGRDGDGPRLFSTRRRFVGWPGGPHRPSGPTLDAGKYGAESNRGARDDGIEISGRSSLIKKFDQPPTTLGALLGEPTDLASAVKTTGYWHYRRAGGPVTSNGKDDSARHDDRCDANGHPVLESWIRLTPRFK